MKALSIRQPWAWAILHAGKDIENRSWKTRFRGEFYIHASKGMTRHEYESFKTQYYAIKPMCLHEPVPQLHDLDRGGIVGIATLIDCVEASDRPWFFGKYGWVLENVRPVPFIPCKGALGFFTPDLSERAE